MSQVFGIQSSRPPVFSKRLSRFSSWGVPSKLNVTLPPPLPGSRSLPLCVRFSHSGFSHTNVLYVQKSLKAHSFLIQNLRDGGSRLGDSIHPTACHALSHQYPYFLSTLNSIIYTCNLPTTQTNQNVTYLWISNL